MSKYTDYDDVSKNYDAGRVCDGVDTMTNVLVGLLRKSVDQIHVLEAGCGTGNYSLGFLQNGIGKLTMIDASNGMLEKAKSKVQSYGSRVADIRQHRLPSLPFADDSFDVVTLIQVAHHLDICNLEDESVDGKNSSSVGDDMEVPNKKSRNEVNDGSKYPNLEMTCKEAYRVLKPGGVLLIDHCFYGNLDASLFSLTPKALSLIKSRYMPEGDLLDMLKKKKFVNIFYVQRPDSHLLREDLANDIAGITDENWRKLDSGWSFVEKTGELPDVIELITKKKSEGKLDEFANELKRQQRIIGYHTTVFSQKPKSD